MNEFESLLESWRRDELSDEQHAALEERLRSDPKARRAFREAAHFDRTVREWSSTRSGEALTGWTPPAERRSRKWTWYASHPGTVLAAAASIAIFASIGSFFVGEQRGNAGAEVRSEENSAGYAVLTRLWDAEIASPQGKLHPGDTLMAGTLELKRGMAQVEFFSGATVLLEGESSLEILSAWEAACSAGKVQVHVPPPARGFRLQTPGMELVDLGTEFGVEVDAEGAAQVHVFDGEVEAYPDNHEKSLLVTGQSLLRSADGTPTPGTSDPNRFLSIHEMNERSAARAQQRFDEWFRWSQQQRKDPRLLAYYVFKHWEDDRWDRLINNVALPRNPSFSGGAVGARWTEGRWPQKDALEFKNPGDRVRIALDCETFDAITLSGWVRVDALDRMYNALLLTDGYEAGEPHWQIFEDGSLMFSLSYADPDKPGAKNNQIYHSPPLFTLANQGRWHHVAVTYENQKGECIQYLDGKEVSREVSEFHEPGRPLEFGPAEIGNWGLPTERHEFPIRNLNGRIDEFAIYEAALSGEEIAHLYEMGRPD